MTSRHRFIDTIILFLCSLIFGALFWFGQYWPNNGLDYGTGKMIAGFIAVCIGFGIPALIMLIPGWKLRYTEKWIISEGSQQIKKLYFDMRHI